MAQLDNLVADILAGLVADGGVTLRTDGGDVPTSGFIVGGVGTVSMPRDEVTSWTIEHWVRTRLAEGAQYIGAWVDSETDQVYLDESIHVAEYADARVLGQLAGEIAIWDLASQSEVRLAPVAV